MYGYNNVEVSPYLHTSIVSDDKRSPERLFNVAADILAANGYNEMMSNSLTKGSYAELTGDIDRSASVKLLNPLSSDLDTLRQSLLFSGLEAVARNISFRNSDLRLLNLAKRTTSSRINTWKSSMYRCLLPAKKNTESWRGAQQDCSFYDLRADFDRVMGALGVKNLSCKPCDSDIFAEAVEIFSRKTPVARIGKVARRILKAFDIDQDVFYCDVLWENVLKISRGVKTVCSDLPKFPSVRRDLALVVDKDVTYQQLYDTAFSAERSILRCVNLVRCVSGCWHTCGEKIVRVEFYSLR